MFRILAIIVVLAVTASAFRFSRDAVLKSFVDGNALKVISGLNNFNTENVCSVASAADIGGASHVDVACDPKLVALAKSVCSLPVCVSSVRPLDFVAAVNAGADMVELGNFDSFYDQGIKFSAADVIAMTIETRALLPSIPLSVTVPHTLSLPEQVKLAQRLEECGADVIQTEGKMVANVSGLGIQEMIELAAPTLASAFAISRAVKIPVMCASGLNDATAPLAIAAGARGVGIGSMVNKLPNKQQMLLAVTAVATSIGRSQKAAETVDVSSSQMSTITTKVNA